MIKKIIIILILLSMISVIGCSNDQEHTQEIQDLEREIENLKFDLALSHEINKMYREALEDIKEENDDIEGILEEFFFGYLTRSNFMDGIYYHTSNIEDILKGFNIK